MPDKLTISHPAVHAPLLADLMSPEARANPYPVYRRYREQRPRHHAPEGLWTFTRHADVMAVLRDDRFSADPRNATVLEETMPRQEGDISPIREVAGRVLLFTDPPDHTRMRNLVNKAFTRRTVEALRDHITEFVRDLLDQAAAKGEMDVIEGLAYPLPALVICELMGVPTEDRDRFRGMSGDIAPILDPITPPETMHKAIETVGLFGLYFLDLLGKRKAEPADDLLSALIHARDEDQRLSDEEVLGLCILLFIAGHETTQNLIGNGLLALLRHPEQLALLRERPELTRNAIEELLRYDSPVQLTARAATDDIEVSGDVIPKGHEVVVLLGAANRDPEVFEDPESLDITRERPQVLSFGAGVHFCLGAPLARLEGEIVFRALLEGFETIELTTDEPTFRNTLTLRGLQSLPVRLVRA